MDLDWITLYDYMSIFSRSEITSKINKFYESFYPMKLKKTLILLIFYVILRKGSK